MKHFYLTAITVLVVNLMSMAQNQGWRTVYVEWNPTTVHGKVAANDFNFNASFSVGFSRAIALSNKIPVYLEAGVAAQFMHKNELVKERDDDHDYWYRESKDYNMLSLRVPINVLYEFRIPNTNVDLIPYTGITLRGNLWGQYKEIDEGFEYFHGDYDEWYYSDSYNLFSDNEKTGMGKKKAWKRFQMGWQIGAKALFANKFVVGVAFGIDFLEIANNNKMRSGNFMIGYKF